MNKYIELGHNQSAITGSGYMKCLRPGLGSCQQLKVKASRLRVRRRRVSPGLVAWEDPFLTLRS